MFYACSRHSLPNNEYFLHVFQSINELFHLILPFRTHSKNCNNRYILSDSIPTLISTSPYFFDLTLNPVLIFIHLSIPITSHILRIKIAIHFLHISSFPTALINFVSYSFPTSFDWFYSCEYSIPHLLLCPHSCFFEFILFIRWYIVKFITLYHILYKIIFYSSPLFLSCSHPPPPFFTLFILSVYNIQSNPYSTFDILYIILLYQV